MGIYLRLRQQIRRMSDQELAKIEELLFNEKERREKAAKGEPRT